MAARVLWLATDSPIAAGTRHRAVQLFPCLQAAGMSSDLSPFFETRRETERPAGPLTRLRRVALGGTERAWRVARAGKYDAAVVLRELAPLSWNHAAAFLARRTPVVFDVDDAVWLPRAGGGVAARLARPETTRKLARAAAVVWAGNAFLADFARSLNVNVEIVPTVVDTSVWKPGHRPDDRKIPVVGWIGTPDTFRYLEAILPAIEEAGRAAPFRLQVVGAGRQVRLQNVEVESVAWRLENDHELFQDLDVGLYPLDDEPWALGKCGFKAIQYLSCGVPAIVSPVGVNREIVRDGIDGIWVRTTKEWTDAIVMLVRDRSMRTRLGACGPQSVLATYSLDAIAPRVVASLRRVIG